MKRSRHRPRRPDAGIAGIACSGAWSWQLRWRRHAQRQCSPIEPQCRSSRPVEQPSSGMDADAGDELDAGETAGPDIGVETTRPDIGVGVSDPWHPGRYGDHNDGRTNRCHENRADQGARGMTPREDGGTPIDSDSGSCSATNRRHQNGCDEYSASLARYRAQSTKVHISALDGVCIGGLRRVHSSLG